MVAIAFSISVDGDVQLSRALSRFGEASGDLREYFTTAEHLIGASVMEQFLSQGSRTSSWAPLSPRYAEWKLSRVGAKPILQFSGAMKASFRTITRKSDEFVWGSKDRKAIYHQRGTVRMAQRRIIDLNKDDRKELMKELQRFLVYKSGLKATSS